MTHSVDERVIQKLFAKLSIRYGALWTSRLGENGNWKDCEDDWLEELKQFTFTQLRAAVKKALALYIEYPPTLGQLIHLCMKESGVPDASEVIKMMVARDFSHPLVKMVYDKIGSWTLTNGKAEEIERKVKEHYSTACSEFHIEPQRAWSQLECFNAKSKELPAPSKIPTTSESKSFKECMAKCQELLRDKKIAGGGQTYKHFDETKIKQGHKDFDQAVFDEYREYLMEIPETQTMILPPVYLMERNKFLNMREQKAWLLKGGYVPVNQRTPHEQQRSGNGKPTQAYKNWHGE
tara:strand:- start:277 stop:1155 length:879 start_codon:yes stop_codon:yes gene_type:complete